MSIFKLGNGKVQISAEAIEKRIYELGQQITKDYEGKDLHLIGVLNGAFIFMADLARAIDLPLSVDFLSVSSYGSSQESSGEVRLTKDLNTSLKGKHVLFVEDIVDTGLTINYLLNYLQGRGPLSLKVVTLLSKPARRKVTVSIDYMGFEIDDAFVYGYGLDVDQKFRNIPFITSQS
jgi:hypoxanthine phosphoribosyltransferase